MSSAVDLKTKEEKDAELDRRIEALRKKNEALVKRYQEIEEDKKKAEQEGIAVTTPRKPRPQDVETDKRRTEKENITVTVDPSKPAGEKRVANDWKPGTPLGRKTSEGSDMQRGLSDGRSPPRGVGSGRVARGGHRGGEGRGGRQERREPKTPRDGDTGDSGGQGHRGGRRGRGGRGGGGGGGGEGTPGGTDRKSKEWEEKRRHNIEQMKEEMEKIAEYERGQRVEGDKPIRNFLDDPRRTGPVPDSDRKEGSRRHVRNWGGLDFDNVKTGPELEKEWTSRRPGPKGSTDMTMSMTGRERAEYLRWKKEREQIDEERLARHRNATGQWRREWDAQKTDGMFKEDPCAAAAEGVITEQGGDKRDEHKRPPKAPTFGDFLSQGRTPGSRGERSRGRGRGQKQSYSMHDNRWEGEKEDEEPEKEREKEKEKEREKEDRTKREKTKKREKEEDEEHPKPAAQKVEKKSDVEDEDEDEWEDASDGEEGSDSESDEKKDADKEKLSPSSSARSPKEQRTPRPKIHIPPPAQDSPEGGKPVSPFFLLDGHRPVSDWGEEMEMQSPRSSMGGDSPLKPPSAESSPPQKKEQEEDQEEDQEQKRTVTEDVSHPPSEPDLPQTETASKPEPPQAGVSHPAPSALSEPIASEEHEPPASSSQDKPDPPPLLVVHDAELSVNVNDSMSDAAPTAVSEEQVEHTVSG
uniref:Coiled-coil domain containing 9 n=1 Tax=Gouania willdenowi TaxID=441366 RepID=A0A8C5DWB0_GOUWI